MGQVFFIPCEMEIFDEVRHNLFLIKALIVASLSLSIIRSLRAGLILISVRTGASWLFYCLPRATALSHLWQEATAKSLRNVSRLNFVCPVFSIFQGALKEGQMPDEKLIRYIIAVIPAHVPGQHIWARPGPGPDSKCFSGTWQCGAWGWERSLMRPTFFQYFCACWTAATLLSCKQISCGKKNAPGLRKSKTVIYPTKNWRKRIKFSTNQQAE